MQRIAQWLTTKQCIRSLNVWSPDSWKEKKIVQDVQYDDGEQFEKVKTKAHLPPLVSIQEVQSLRKQLAEVAENKRFLLQGGDCAELFEYCSQSGIENRLKVLLQMPDPVVRIARMAGQYAKPRSNPYETLSDENVNGIEIEDRKPDPKHLHHPDSWNLEDWDLETSAPQIRLEYQTILAPFSTTLSTLCVPSVLTTWNPNTLPPPSRTSAVRTVDLFTSHEGPSSTTSNVSPAWNPADGRHYNLGTHFIWIGDRTRQIDGAHVEFFRGLANPVGVKVGPSMKPEELGPLLDILDPFFETGKITLITRYGYDKIQDDPMHGNTESVNGIKTRRFEHIVDELSKAFQIHDQFHSRLGGVHFELTGDRVTEAIGRIYGAWRNRPFKKLSDISAIQG
ncbi:hypothetical protein BC829DRAFT_427453 [Chytridium lagenaria]|nr:hypothetical protein BC829DRAFT_427453 [Chytridium lagenaria]